MSSNDYDQREALAELQVLADLHRPLGGNGVFKGGLSGPAPAVPRASAYGWICAKCGGGNAPHRETCAICTKPYA